jgi:hypothetical protein
LLAALAREGTYQFAWDEWQNWRDRQAAQSSIDHD